MIILLSGDFGVCDAGQIALREEKRALLRAIEPRGIDRAAEIGDEHPIAGNVEGDADPFHQIAGDDFGCAPISDWRIDRSTIDRIAERRVAAIGPVEHTALEIELEVNRFGQVVKPYLDVRSISGALTFGDLYARPEDAAEAGIVRPLLCPVDLPTLGIDRDSNAPPSR